MDQPMFEAIVCHMEMMKRAREYDNRDYGGTNTPTAKQLQAAKTIISKAQELRNILRG